MPDKWVVPGRNGDCKSSIKTKTLVQSYPFPQDPSSQQQYIRVSAIELTSTQFSCLF